MQGRNVTRKIIVVLAQFRGAIAFWNASPAGVGAPVRAIQEMAGHAELTMTQRYMHLSPASLDAAIGIPDAARVRRSRGDGVETVLPRVGTINKTGE
jgi:hypothetical protein